MSERIRQIEYLSHISDELKSGNISISEISYEDVYKCIVNTYCKNDKIDQFIKIYMNLLVKGLQHGDKDSIGDIISLLANHGKLSLQIENHKMKMESHQFKLMSRLMHQINLKRVEIWHLCHQIKASKIPFVGKGVIYTAIMGDYDDVKEPKYINPEYDYILFTNNRDITSKIWNVRYVDNEEQLDNVRLARKFKIVGHRYLSEYDFSIWIDGKLEIIGDMDSYKNKYRRKEPILCFNHYANDCIYKEKETCLSLKKDETKVMEKQIERYRQEGYPENNGLIDSAIMVRDLHDERVENVMETWWEEVLNGSKRDQLSFNYSCWKNDFVYDTSDLFSCENEYVKVYSHK